MPRKNSNVKPAPKKVKRSYRKKIKLPARPVTDPALVVPSPVAEQQKDGKIKWNISDALLAKSKLKATGEYIHPFVLPTRPPLPKGMKPSKTTMALDQQVIQVNAWAAEAVYNGAFYNGMAFMGYPYLSELAQRPEYRRLVEVLSTEMTRKWITIKSTGKDQRQKKEQIDQLIKRMDALDVRGVARKAIENDGFFGRSHIYIDTGSTDDQDELVQPIGDGGNDDGSSNLKFTGKKNFLKAFKCIEPVWCYPARYDAMDPLKPDWYNPQTWLVQGKELHVSRLLTLVGREVPDLLKPAYNFGGMSLSQLAKPYVDNWLRTRQSVADLIWTFSVMVLKTDLTTLLGADGQELMKRAALFSNLRTNQGLMMINKDSEDFSNVSAPLSGMEALQAQSQEHMCSVTGTPVVKLLGIQPAGLNASSEGELTTWYDWVAAFQEKFLRRPLQTMFNWVQRDLWGKVDEDLYFEFEQLQELTEKELADLQKTFADTDAALVGAGIIDPEEVRQAMANDPQSRYHSIEVEDVPEPPQGEEGGEGEEDGMGGIMGGLGVSEEDRPDDARRDDGEREDDPTKRRDENGEEAGARKNGAEQPRAKRTEPRKPEARAREPRSFDS